MTSLVLACSFVQMENNLQHDDDDEKPSHLVALATI
jgi:hypothetical protein